MNHSICIEKQDRFLLARSNLGFSVDAMMFKKKPFFSTGHDILTHIAKWLADGDDIGHGAVALKGPEGVAHAAESGLHLVGDIHAAMGSGELEHAAQVSATKGDQGRSGEKMACGVAPKEVWMRTRGTNECARGTWHQG